MTATLSGNPTIKKLLWTVTGTETGLSASETNSGDSVTFNCASDWYSSATVTVKSAVDYSITATCTITRVNSDPLGGITGWSIKDNKVYCGIEGPGLVYGSSTLNSSSATTLAGGVGTARLYTNKLEYTQADGADYFIVAYFQFEGAIVKNSTNAISIVNGTDSNNLIYGFSRSNPEGTAWCSDGTLAVKIKYSHTLNFGYMTFDLVVS